MSKLDDIKKRCDAATAGPWVSDTVARWGALGSRLDDAVIVTAPLRDNKTVVEMPTDVMTNGYPTSECRATGAFIAHARADVPWLLEALRLADEMRSSVEIFVRDQADALCWCYDDMDFGQLCSPCMADLCRAPLEAYQAHRKEVD